MSTPSCQLQPPVALGLIDEAGDLIVLDDATGVLVLIALRIAANDELKRAA